VGDAHPSRSCRALGDDDLIRTFDIGCGTLRQTFLHMISADI
jgi:hypothetical protein